MARGARGALIVMAVVLAAIVAGCGGGSTTTIIEKTVASKPSRPKPPIGPALLKLPTYEHWTIEPTVYGFSVDGALSGRNLTWDGWGTPRATGSGTIAVRIFGTENFREYPGGVVATGLRKCDGRDFYTSVEAKLPAEAKGGPSAPLELETPCTGGAPLEPGSVTDRAEEEVREREEAETEAEEKQRRSAASPGRKLDSYCSPTGDYCTGVFASGLSINATLSAFSSFGAYELCLRPPGERFDCDGFTMREVPHGIYEGRVDLAHEFGPLGRGEYAVRWVLSGEAIGSTLHFRVG